MQRRIFLGLLASALLAMPEVAEAGHLRSRRRRLTDVVSRRRRRSLRDEWFDLSDDDEDDFDEDFDERPRRRRVRRRRETSKRKTARREGYKGKTIVAYRSGERAGTIVISTGERALYYVLGGGKAIRYGVAVGKEGFQWSGTARIGAKVVNPGWTPPAEMIERRPELAEWAGGMPGGIPENPLGVRALYLYKGRRDTLYRIHGTNEPGSIGRAASSGCIRMLNSEVIDLYRRASIGTKVIVR